ncbi:AAA domain-containing protein [Baffinella frigidus]|nr:AAA domain-containing protein [Cryptophyta sp. CCMP2293]
MAATTRKLPNVLITGTPGTGKTTTAEKVAAALEGFTNVNVGDLVKTKNLHGGKHEDEELDCFVLDEDMVCDELEEQMTNGGNVVDFHTCDFFPERWFDLVVVLRCDNEKLYPRLEARGYSAKKIEENVDAEIMCVVAEDARESYKEEIIWTLESNSLADMEANVARIATQLGQWGGVTPSLS